MTDDCLPELSVAVGRRNLQGLQGVDLEVWEKTNTAVVANGIESNCTNLFLIRRKMTMRSHCSLFATALLNASSQPINGHIAAE